MQSRRGAARGADGGEGQGCVSRLQGSLGKPEGLDMEAMQQTVKHKAKLQGAQGRAAEAEQQGQGSRRRASWCEGRPGHPGWCRRCGGSWPDWACASRGGPCWGAAHPTHPHCTLHTTTTTAATLIQFTHVASTTTWHICTSFGACHAHTSFVCVGLAFPSALMVNQLFACELEQSLCLV